MRKFAPYGEGLAVKVAIIGMGYVGIPEAVLFTTVPWIDKVYGIQRRSETSGYKIGLLNSGELPFDEPDLEPILREAISAKKFECTDDYSKIGECGIIVVAVQTNDLVPLDSAIEYIIKHAQKRYTPLVVIVSTVPPGTTDSIKHKLDAANKYLSVVHAPERVTPKKLVQNIRTYPRVIGGYTPLDIKRARELYKAIGVPSFIEMSPIEAEITKTAENGIRAVQIAMANQIAIICETSGANFYTVKRGIDSLKGDGVSRAMLLPGAGVGGHCLPKDGNLLSTAMPNKETTLFNIATRINTTMTNHMWKLTEDAMASAGFEPREVTITIFGWSYMKNTTDTRNSPAIAYKDIAERAGSKICVYDPVCKADPTCKSCGFKRACQSDVFVVITDHDVFQSIFVSLHNLRPKRGKPLIIIDGRNAVDPKKYIEKGWIYRGIGRGDIV